MDILNEYNSCSKMICEIISPGDWYGSTFSVNNYLSNTRIMTSSEMKIAFPIVSIDIINIRIQIKDQ